MSMNGSGFLENLSQKLAPHTNALSQTISNTGVLLHLRLENIERSLSDLTQPDIGNKFFRMRITGTQKAERINLAEVPINEIWQVMYLATNGTKEKTPAFTIEINNALIFAFNKEGTGQESPGGDVVALPGENIELVPEAEGKFNVNIIFVKRRLPTNKIPTGMGTTKGKMLPSNTHDPARDVIGSATGRYVEISGEQDFEERGPSS